MGFPVRSFLPLPFPSSLVLSHPFLPAWVSLLVRTAWLAGIAFLLLIAGLMTWTKVFPIKFPRLE